MNPEPAAFRKLLCNSLIAVALGAALVALCYFFVDVPFARYVSARDHGLDPVLKWLTYPPPTVEVWVPVLLAALMVRRAWGPPWRCGRALLAAGVALVVAARFRESISYAMGRTWPETWVNDNPSFIRDGVYGFHPFHGGAGYTSFPSGHTARAAAVAAVFWVAYPWWRWACVLAPLAIAAGLLGLDYHFVGDVVAGAFVGGVVGASAAHCCGVANPAGGASTPPATSAAPPSSGALPST